MALIIGCSSQNQWSRLRDYYLLTIGISVIVQSSASHRRLSLHIHILRVFCLAKAQTIFCRVSALSLTIIGNPVTPWYGLRNDVWSCQQQDPTDEGSYPKSRTERSFRHLTEPRPRWSESDRTDASEERRSWSRLWSTSIRWGSCLKHKSNE